MCMAYDYMYRHTWTCTYACLYAQAPRTPLCMEVSTCVWPAGSHVCIGHVSSPHAFAYSTCTYVKLTLMRLCMYVDECACVIDGERSDMGRCAAACLSAQIPAQFASASCMTMHVHVRTFHALHHVHLYMYVQSLQYIYICIYHVQSTCMC